MRQMAKRALAGLERRVQGASLKPAEHRAVTVKAKLVLRLYEKRLGLARVRTVASGAFAGRHGSMHAGLIELFLFVCVAGIAERLYRRCEQPGIF